MNVIELVKKYLPVLDEQYRQQSKTAVLDMPKEWVRDTLNAKKVKVAKYKTDKLGNYSRSTGFVKGSMELDWEEHEFKIDRGRSIQVDHEDNEETFGMAFGRLAGVFQKEAVIPEMDAYRIAVYATAAGHQDTYTLGSGILKKIDHLDALMDDEEVPEEGRILFVIPTVYEDIINDASVEHKLEVNDELTKALNKKIYSYNTHPIIKITSKRMYTAIDLLDGVTSGQEAGGYVKSADGKQVGMLMVTRDAVVQISKRVVARIWAPSRELAAGCDGVNPDADAWKFDFRVYHDAWVLENKANALACLTLASNSNSGEGTNPGTNP
jgi:flagellin-specific chaperone FliS